jgi:hypothetical protein
MGGECIFVNKNLNFMNIDLSKFSHEQDIEAGAVKLLIHLIFTYYPFIEHLLVILPISLIN